MGFGAGMMETDGLLTTEEFRARLQQIGEERYHHRHPFHLLMHEGKLIRCGTPAELKAGMAGRFWEVEAPDMRAARRSLEARPGVLGVKPSGATLHVHSTAEVTLSDWLPARLIEPSLEDVFVAVVSEEEQHA